MINKSENSTVAQTEVATLKYLIDVNGPNFLRDHPYEVYQKLLGTPTTDDKTSRAILFALVSNIDKIALQERDYLTLSSIIQNDCDLKKKTSDKLAQIFLELYSDENIKEWKDNNLSGWKDFVVQNLKVDWEGCSVWSYRGGSVTCHYNAKIALKPLENIQPSEELLEELKKNPFMDSYDIGRFYQDSLTKYLDDDFDEYVSADDYYEPVVEDFGVDYAVKDWCKKNGFEMISSEGSGHDDGYDPDFY